VQASETERHRGQPCKRNATHLLLDVLLDDDVDVGVLLADDVLDDDDVAVEVRVEVDVRVDVEDCVDVRELVEVRELVAVGVTELVDVDVDELVRVLEDVRVAVWVRDEVDVREDEEVDVDVVDRDAVVVAVLVSEADTASRRDGGKTCGLEHRQRNCMQHHKSLTPPPPSHTDFHTTYSPRILTSARRRGARC
jgi:hypothetical protein